MGVYGGPYIVRNSSLILELDAADKNSYAGSGTVWNDLSGNNISGSLTNGPTFNNENGGSIIFDGSNDYVSLQNTSLLNFGTNDFSIELWIKPGPIMAGTLFTINGNNTYYAALRLQVDSNFALGYLMSINGTSWANGGTLANNTFPSGSYGQLVFTRSGTSGIFYANGTSVGTGSTPADSLMSFSAGTTNRLGHLSATINSYYNGGVANLRIYTNKTLSASEILQNYNAQKSRFGL